jgi:methyl-accepting chemotaxis protein
MDRNHRKTLLIDPPFQTQFISKFCMMIIITSLVLGGAVYFLTRGSTTVAIENTRVYAKPTADFILPSLSATVLVVAFLSALGVLVSALFISHKIVGPIFRLQREVVRVSEGDLVRNFNIRDKDQFQVLAQSLNLMASTFRAKHAALREAHLALSAFLQEKDFSVSSGDKEALRKMLEKMNTALNYFKV